MSLAVEWYLLFRARLRWLWCLAAATAGIAGADVALWLRPAIYDAHITVHAPITPAELQLWEQQHGIAASEVRLPLFVLRISVPSRIAAEDRLNELVGSLRPLVDRMTQVAVIESTLRVLATAPEDRPVVRQREGLRKVPQFWLGPMLVRVRPKPWQHAQLAAGLGAVILVGVLPILLAEWWRREWQEYLDSGPPPETPILEPPSHAGAGYGGCSGRTGGRSGPGGPGRQGSGPGVAVKSRPGPA